MPSRQPPGCAHTCPTQTSVPQPGWTLCSSFPLPGSRTLSSGLYLLSLLLALRFWSLCRVHYKLHEEQGLVGASPRHRDISSGPGSCQVPVHELIQGSSSTWVGGMQPKVLLSVPCSLSTPVRQTASLQEFQHSPCRLHLSTWDTLPRGHVCSSCLLHSSRLHKPTLAFGVFHPACPSPPSLPCRRAPLWVWAPVCRVTLPARGEQVGAQAWSRTPCQDHRKSE